MKKKSGKKVVLSLLALLLLTITVGYAALSTTLNINGTSKINNATWDVHFANLEVTSGSVSATKAATIDSATEIDYNVELIKPGDFYEFTVDVTNTGTIDAKLGAAPILNGVSAEQDVYTNYTVTYSDNTAIHANDKLAAGATKKLKVRVEFDRENITNSQLPTEAQTLNLTFAMNYVQD